MQEIKRRILGIKGTMSKGLEFGVEHNAEMYSMIGWHRLNNIEQLIRETMDVPGDFIEAGVWRGGACIFARLVYDAMGSDKKVYVADSFEGLPKPDAQYIADKGDRHYAVPMLSVSLEQVKKNFADFGIKDNVEFVKGWFKDTLHKIDTSFSIIRIDGDMYGSTIEALNALYPKLNKGGFCIIDDYGVVPGCKHAVSDYRNWNAINSEIISIDGTGIYWQK